MRRLDWCWFPFGPLARLYVVTWVGLTAALVSPGCGDSGAPTAQRPAVGGARAAPDRLVRNVLVISLDTLRADRLETYGYGRPTSPNLDGLARRSVVFERVWAQAPQTAPSHASLFTSEYAGAHQVVNVHGEQTRVHRLPPEASPLAEVLHASGIETSAFVSGGNLTRRMGMERGFDVWDETFEDVRGRVDACVRWMLAPDRGPFFAFLHTYQVHAPYLPPEEVYPAFVDGAYDGPLRSRLEEFLQLSDSEAWAGGVGARYWEGMLDYDAADVKFLSDLYDAEIAGLDVELRRLFEYVLGSDLAQDTAIIVLSDHGEEFLDHGKYQHDQVFEELLRVPLIVRMPPALEAEGYRGRVATPVQLVDVAPTVLELMGVSGEGLGWAGRSLVPLMRPDGPQPNWDDRPLFAELVIGGGPKYYHAVTWQGWKYIHAWQADIDHKWEWLFHLDADPGERRNLIDAEDPAARRALESLRGLRLQQEAANAARAAELGSGGSVEMDAETREQMRQLGYIDG